MWPLRYSVPYVFVSTLNVQIPSPIGLLALDLTGEKRTTACLCLKIQCAPITSHELTLGRCCQ